MRRFINKIIDRIQRKRAIKNHRKMWHWLAENPGKSKIEFLLEHDSSNRVLFNGCYLCDYATRAKQRAGGGMFCKYCPLDWGAMSCCNGTHLLYDKWQAERLKLNPNKQRIAELALQIAELPEKVEK